MRRPAPILTAVTMTVLAGCAAGQSGSGPAAQTTSPATENSTAVARATAPARTTPSRPRAELTDLIGADAARIDRFLGTPEIVRQEGPAEMRLYRSRSCVLHVFLYPRDGRKTASHIEARRESTRLDDRQLNSCVASFS